MAHGAAPWRLIDGALTLSEQNDRTVTMAAAQYTKPASNPVPACGAKEHLRLGGVRNGARKNKKPRHRCRGFLVTGSGSTRRGDRGGHGGVARIGHWFVFFAG